MSCFTRIRTLRNLGDVFVSRMLDLGYLSDRLANSEERAVPGCRPLPACRCPSSAPVRQYLTRMTLDAFIEICESGTSPEGLSEPLQSLYWDKRGDWDHAHSIAQQIPTTRGSLVHAYLHREEGDLSNSRYWYNRAGRPMLDEPLETEWREIAAELCD